MSQKEEGSTALAKIGSTKYAILARPTEEVRDIISFNMGGDQLEISDLVRTKVPSGGGAMWNVGENATKEISGVIIFHQSFRSYWPGKYEGGHQPPQCVSIDCISGTGNPGGICKTCPFSKFGTAELGGGQACKNGKRIFMMTPGSLMPIMVTVPPTSMKACKQYFAGLSSQNPVMYYGVVTKMSLKKEKNATGIEYAQIVFERGETLNEQQTASFKNIADAMRPMLQMTSNTVIDGSDMTA